MPLRIPHLLALALAIATCLLTAAFAVAADPEPQALTPSTFDVIFDNVPVGSTSAPQTVTVKNYEHDDVEIGKTSIVGPHPSDFLLSTDTCSGQTLDAGETCQLGVRFKPNANGTRVAHIKMPHDGAGCTLWITLAGSGPAAIAQAASCEDDDDDSSSPSQPNSGQSSAPSSSGSSSSLSSPVVANNAIGLPAATTK